MAKPSHTNDYRMIFPVDWVNTMDPLALDSAIRGQGVTLVHWRAQRCPVGLVDQYDIRRPHDDHSGCSNGFTYTKAGEITTLFTGNSENLNLIEPGLLWGSSVQVTFPRFYDAAPDASQVRTQILPFDRVYLKDETIVVYHWQLFEAHASGKEKLSFPVVEVTDLMDNQGNRYGAGDFIINGGQIIWTGSHRPAIDAVCSVRYSYRPYYYVKNMLHEIRVVQTDNPITGERNTERMPQAAILQREYVFENTDKDPDAQNPDDPRQVKGPRDGQFGPR